MEERRSVVRKIGRKFAGKDEVLATKLVRVGEDWFVTEGFPQQNTICWGALILRGILDRTSHDTPFAHSDFVPTRKQFFEGLDLNEDDCALAFYEGIQDYFSDPLVTVERATKLLDECRGSLTKETVRACGAKNLIRNLRAATAMSESAIERVKELSA